MNDSDRSLTKWKVRHTIIVWIGIILNFVIIAALMICPQWTLKFFQIPEVASIWPRSAALLLAIISIFYIPATINIDRYRVFAWLSVFPSRTFGTVFFFFAVFVFSQPLGFAIWVVLDGGIGVLSLWCLLRIQRLEEEILGGRDT